MKNILHSEKPDKLQNISSIFKLYIEWSLKTHQWNLIEHLQMIQEEDEKICIPK